MKALANATFLMPPGSANRTELHIMFISGAERDAALHELQRLRSGLPPTGLTLVAAGGQDTFALERRHLVDGLGFLYVKASEQDADLPSAHARVGAIAGICRGLLRYLKAEPPLTFAELGKGLVQ